jgi:hypothetical protein
MGHAERRAADRRLPSLRASLSRVSVPIPKVAAKACYQWVRQERVRNLGCSRCAYRVEFGRTTPVACWLILWWPKTKDCAAHGVEPPVLFLMLQENQETWPRAWVILLPPRTSPVGDRLVIWLQKTARTAAERCFRVITGSSAPIAAAGPVGQRGVCNTACAIAPSSRTTARPHRRSPTAPNRRGRPAASAPRGRFRRRRACR